ncbi:MAG: kynureninase, partial [Acidobacteriota bacterium]
HEAPQGGVAYGAGAAAFAGATYDPTSHYRGAAVFDFFEAHSLDGDFLRRVSQHQVGRLAARFDALDAPPSVVSRPAVPLEELGAFLTLYSHRAAELSAGLRERGVSTDVRGDQLRFGPAPYLCDRQLDDAVEALGDVVRGIEGR